MLKKLLNDAAIKTAEEYEVKPKTSEEMYGGELVGSVKKGKPEKYYPSISLDASTLPEIKDWTVGNDYYILMRVTQKSLNVNESSTRKSADARFDIKEIAVIDPETADEPSADVTDAMKNL